MKLVCRVCGYVYEGEAAPGQCPRCGQQGVMEPAGGGKAWECRSCGHIVAGEAAPEICPVCAHPQAYFEINAEND